VKVLRGHHVSFAVSDVARARRFYGELLGFEEIARPDFGFPGAWYQVGEIQVHLIQPPPGTDVGARPRSISPVAGHAAFQIDDYTAAETDLRARQVPFVGLGPAVGQLFVQDPDGNVIELIVPGGRLGRSSS
jgi:catechol 2,3-dioxygenase-like lactoylglutathione lyase family enzyme